MRYTVIFSPSAEQDLADIYNNASDKWAVTWASDLLERMLKRDAHKVGRDYDGDRMVRVAPLLAFFAVYPDDCRVEVLQLAYVESV